MGDYSHRSSFVFAIALHVIIIFFLLIKFNNSSSSQVALNRANTFINAVIINERDINIQKLKPQQQEQKLAETTKPIVEKHEKIIKKQLVDINQNLLLSEQAELKKERLIHKKAAAKKEQQHQMQVLQDQVAAEQKQLAGEQSQGEVDKYKYKIIQAISAQWSYPAEVADEKVSGQLLVNIAPNGDVLSVKLLSSSGNEILDRSAQAAVSKASPLPIPEDTSLFEALIKIKFTPSGFM